NADPADDLGDYVSSPALCFHREIIHRQRRLELLVRAKGGEYLLNARLIRPRLGDEIQSLVPPHQVLQRSDRLRLPPGDVLAVERLILDRHDEVPRLDVVFGEDLAPATAAPRF